ncbi:DUF1146 domain-containing protein [Paenibacillus sp. GCM10027627]|uniref:DUF1146 domain-containing protein n=1 Tax=unclassified Paenibacillus TaxID=185978 RepID=UPI0036368FFE
MSDDLMNNMVAMTGWTGLFSIVIELVSIFLVWTLLREVKWDAVFHFPRSSKARLLQLLIAVGLGHLFAQFILQYWNYTAMLKGFVE